MIAKKIHYCWFGKKPFPKLVEKCLASWRKQLPDYELCLWNEENSPMEHPFVKSAYEAKKYAFVADYVRLWALYNHGGIYLDTDMYVVKSFDDLLNNTCFFAYHDAEAVYIEFCAVGVLKHNDTIKQLMQKYDGIHFSVDRIGDYVIPRLLTPVLNEYKSEVTIYPYDYFYPFPYEKREDKNFKKYLTPNTYAIHLWNLSWHTRYEKLISALIKFIKKCLTQRKKA
ncbi:MAG: glycosyl transferase [Prevotellaceae bacterium]|jgi:mannosyltransferase OCH1-like enzyme|nr:glycosyl transferase [Prevotellaceae bacterium]